MKKLLIILLLFTCIGVHSQDVEANNAIKMAYNFTTVAQTVVFNSAMQAGGTLTLSAQAMDGGGRSPGDPLTLKLVFYNSSNAVITTVQQAFTLTYGLNTPSTYSVSTANCGGSCTNVAYVSVQFYGKDGGYWAGNYGPYIISPTLTFNGGSNILYNPQFGTYSGTGYAQGWTSSAGWQNCALYSGSATCVIDNGAQVNGGTYSATGGTTSGTSGGYEAAPPAPTYTSNITTEQQARVDAFRARTSTEAGIHIEQIGDNNTITIVQKGRSSIMGIGQDKALIDGDSNQITVRQGVSAIGNNEIKLRVVGNTNTLNLNQANTTQGIAIGGNGHYLYTDIFGSLNTLTTQQSNTGGVGGHYAETTISGNSNNITKLQTGNGNKIMFTNVVGNNNTVTANQKDTGQHYLDLKLTGNGHNANIVQEGSASHRATIDLTNAGGASSIILNQNSNTTPQVYSIQQSCANAAGCSVTVTQNQ
jgi:hypothetical protein